MKNIGAVIASEKVGMVVDALKKIALEVLRYLMQKVEEKENVLNWQDHGALVATQRNLTQNYVFTVVDDSLVDKVISAIIDATGTGSTGDGKIFVTTIDDAIDIGSKQKGVHAI